LDQDQESRIEHRGIWFAMKMKSFQSETSFWWKNGLDELRSKDGKERGEERRGDHVPETSR
jgi:hypothetical protein